MKLLMLSREVTNGGGVVNLVNSVKSCLSELIIVDDFIVGARKNNASLIRRYLQPVIDAWQLFRKVRHSQYDIAHINPSLNFNSLLRDGLFMIVFRITGQPVLVFFHGWDEALSLRIRNNVFYRWLMRLAFGHASCILVLAGKFREQLVGMGLAREKISTITAMFDGAPIEKVREKRNMNGQNILFLSRFIREKGLLELVEAFAEISNEFPKARMVMAGDGPARDELEQAISDAGLSDVIELPGYIRGEDKAAVLMATDIFVLPSYSEGCPVSMLEAMAAGLAVVATSVGGIPDILHDGRNGVLLASADPALIYDALHSLMASPESLMKISETNRDVAWRCYEAETITAEIEAHYNKALNLL